MNSEREPATVGASGGRVGVDGGVRVDVEVGRRPGARLLALATAGGSGVARLLRLIGVAAQ